MTITSAQRKELRRRGQTLSETARLGKNGLNAGFVAKLNELLTQKELVKLRLNAEVEGEARKALAQEVAAAGNAECVALTGRTVLLFRPKSNPA